MAIRPIWQAQAAKRLDEAMERGGIRSAAAARALKAAGLKGGPSMVSLWRNGKRVPDADQLAALLRLCGGSADEVLNLRPGPDLARAFRAEVAEHGPTVACERASRLVLELVGHQPGKPTRAR